MSEIKLSQEQFERMDNVVPTLSSVIQKLEGAIHPSILKQLNQVQDDILFAFKDIHDQEDNDFEKEMEKLSQIQEQNNLSSVWSMEKVKSHQINDMMPFKMKSLIHDAGSRTVQMDITKKMTWLEFWKEADKLMLQSGDRHHIFIEDVSETKQKGHYKLTLGS